MEAPKFIKEILSNQHSNDLLDKDFKKLAESNSFIGSTRIKDIYHDIFYEMPKVGKNSHENIIQQSYNHVYSNENRALDVEIKNLTKQTYAKEKELTELETPLLEEHPVYENQSLIVAGENGQSYQDMNTIWIMHEGRKRAFESPEGDVFQITKKALGLPATQFDGRYFVMLSELNAIPDGPPISATVDLMLKGNSLKIDLPDLHISGAYTDINLECLGNEVADYVDSLTDDMLDLDVHDLQFYLGNEACIVKYIKDDYFGDDTGPSLLEISIPKGETQQIRILRETFMQNNMIPSDIMTSETYGYSNNVPTNIAYNGNNINNYWKLWGPGEEYNSIVYASGRITSQEVENAHIGNALSQIGETQNLEKRLFNGLPDETTGVWGESGIQIITNPNYTGQELSNYDTKMIYRNSGYYGALGQSSGLQSKVFDNPNSPYYKTQWYGQPIIRYENTWVIIIKTYKSAGKRIKFLDLVEDESFGKHKSNTNDLIQMDLAGNDILGLRWDTLNQDREIWPGLLEYKTREQSRDDNILNPAVGGSNYEKNQYNTHGN